jgi:type II secretory pathway component GspD/PulD (secretin)
MKNRHHRLLTIALHTGCIVLLLSGTLYAAPSQKKKSGLDRQISVNYVKASLPDVLRGFADYLGLNVVVGPEVQGQVTAEFKDTSALAAFNVIVKMNGYSYKILDVNTIIVGTEKTLEKMPANIMRANKFIDYLPQVFRLKYAKPDDVIPVLMNLFPEARIEKDDKLRYIIVTADPGTVKKMKKLLYGD